MMVSFKNLYKKSTIMSQFNLSYREVIPDQSTLATAKEITLSTGGTQSTLQDIKVSDRSHGYCYKNSLNYYSRNRFIYWRINYDTLELVEHSLDINLKENRIRFRFIDTSILDGVSIHETNDQIVVLVPTVCSVHRLTFPHPNKFHRNDDLVGTHPDLAAPSIFAHTNTLEARNPNNFYVFNSSNITSDQLPNLASSFLTQTEEAIFLLSYSTSELLLIKQTKNGQTFCMELKEDSLMPKFLTGLAEKFRPKNADADCILSLLLVHFRSEPYALTFCRDGQLKFWSCNKSQCVAIINILSENGDIKNDHVQNAILRYTVCEYGPKAIKLVIFLSFPTGCVFHCVDISFDNEEVKILRQNLIYAPENDLIDFAIETNRLWSIWRTENGECTMYTTMLNEKQQWQMIYLESHPDPNYLANVERSNKDPRQIYLEYIFYPGRFPMHIISKALCIYKRSTVLSDTNMSINMLKQHICMAIENEIQASLNEAVVNYDEYLECANWCWQKFYSCVVQYHIAGLKPLGLLLLPSDSGAVFLKKTSFSILRPLEPLEYMFLCSEQIYEDQLMNFPLLNDSNTINDVIKLFQVIVYLEQQISDIFMEEFEHELLNLRAPDVVIDDLLEKIQYEMDSEFVSQVWIMLEQCNNLYNTIHKILELLRYDYDLTSMDNVNQLALHYFNSSLGISFVANCLRQQAQTRFSICRNLLLISKILLQQQKELDGNVLETIRTVCCPELSILTQANFVMVWLSGLTSVINLPHEISVQRLQILKLSPVINLCTSNLHPMSLLEQFIASSGGYEARKSFARTHFGTSELLAQWNFTLLAYLHQITKFIYAIEKSTSLPEWLLVSGQHIYLQQYVHLLSTWCDWNNYTRKFLLAVSFLINGEHYKAQDLFLNAAAGVNADEFLEKCVLRQYNIDDGHILVHYYLLVIQLLELHKAKDCAINVANAALSIVDSDDPLAATLYSIKFKHHLTLKHYEKAFDSLNSNPDTERKKDNLRDLIKILLDEKHFDKLLNFTYGSMDELFTNILLSRARANDSVDNVFYDFLYTYHMKRGPLCYRMAASVMYEQAYRLSALIPQSEEALEKQLKCYLASENVLRLCDKKYAWVVRPSDPDEEEDEFILEPKAGLQIDCKIIKLKRQIEVINAEQIKKELIFASAKLKLIKFNVKSLNITSPIDLVTVLNSVGLFKTALEICTVFDLKNYYANIFESLTKYCILLMEEEIPNVWEWLIENDLQDLPINRDNLSEIVWQLLYDYLMKYEKENMTILHYVICRKIVQMRMFLPHWLLASYKKRNAPELLNLLHANGRLEDAIELVREYLLAAMGYGKEFYGFKQPLAFNTPPFCLPVYNIMNLLKELQLQNDNNVNKPYSKEHKLLSELFDKYCETSTRISNTLCNNVKH